MQSAWVYILTNRPRGVLYTGMTNDLVRRIWEHRQKAVPGFTRKHNCTQLVWYEQHGDVTYAASREYRLKKCRRKWKITLIEDMNPGWHDLWYDISKNAGTG